MASAPGAKTRDESATNAGNPALNGHTSVADPVYDMGATTTQRTTPLRKLLFWQKKRERIDFEAWDRIFDVTHMIAPEDLDKIPTDASSNPDRYRRKPKHP
jgi:hypothetical protein